MDRLILSLRLRLTHALWDLEYRVYDMGMLIGEDDDATYRCPLWVRLWPRMRRQFDEGWEDSGK